MSRSLVEKAICRECGADVRQNTLFCYNCGSKIARAEGSSNDTGLTPDVLLQPADKSKTGLEGHLAAQIDPKARAALDDLADRIKIGTESSDNDAIAQASLERKKKRIAKRRGREFMWEPVEDSPERLMLLIVIVITVLAASAVVLTMIWK